MCDNHVRQLETGATAHAKNASPYMTLRRTSEIRPETHLFREIQRYHAVGLSVSHGHNANGMATCDNAPGGPDGWR